MLKLAIFVCLCCASLVVKGQDPPMPPPNPPSPPAPPTGKLHLEPMEHHRAARQSMPMPPGMSSMPGMQGGNPGNFAMQGLGNVPDPTAVFAKAQEMGKQILGGRRRRDVPTTDMPSIV